MPITKVAPPKKQKKERVPDNERILLSIGLGLTVLFALCFGAIKFAFNQPGSVLDPDAEALIIKPTYPRQLVDFSLTDQAGHQVTRGDLNGRFVVVSFVFTSCSVVCPYVNAQMSKIQQLTSGQRDVKLVSLTLDPVDDTVPVLAKYGHDFGQDAQRWSFLTGDESAMRSLIGTSFLSLDTSTQFASMPGNFANSQRIVLVDPQGSIVEYFDGLNQGAADTVVREIKKLRGSL
jgi:protein SCO1/2